MAPLECRGLSRNSLKPDNYIRLCQVIVDLIGSTTTRRGLKVRAELDTAAYETGIKVSDAELAVIPIEKHSFHGEWNYTVRANKGVFIDHLVYFQALRNGDPPW